MSSVCKAIFYVSGTVYVSVKNNGGKFFYPIGRFNGILIICSYPVSSGKMRLSLG